MGISVFPAASGGLTQKFAEYLSTGTFTPPTGVTTVECLLVAGGGGSGGCRSGGSTDASGGAGGGQVVKTFLTVVPGTSYTITIGAGGAGGASGANDGSNGTNSSFGSLLICGGGGGGRAGTTGGAAGINGNAGTNTNTSAGHGGWQGNVKGGRGLGGGGGGVATTSQAFSTGGGGAGGNAYSPWFTTNVAQVGLGGPSLYGFGAGGDGMYARGSDFQSFAPNANSGYGASAIQAAGTAAAGVTGGSGYALISYWS